MVCVTKAGQHWTSANTQLLPPSRLCGRLLPEGHRLRACTESAAGCEHPVYHADTQVLESGGLRGGQAANLRTQCLGSCERPAGEALDSEPVSARALDVAPAAAGHRRPGWLPATHCYCTEALFRSEDPGSRRTTQAAPVGADPAPAAQAAAMP